MGHLVPRQFEYLFTHEFCDDQPLGLIGHHVLGVVLRPLGKFFLDLIDQPRKILLLARRDRDNRRKIIRLRIGGDHGQALLTWDAVDLVHGEEDGRVYLCKLCEDIAFACPHLLRHIHDEDDDIHAAQSSLRRLRHIAAKRILRLVDAGRIEEDDLCVLLRQNAEDAAARRLRLVAHDRDLLPDQRIDQRGLPDVWPSDDGDKSRFICAHRAIPSTSITCLCSSSISSRSSSSIWS